MVRPHLNSAGSARSALPSGADHDLLHAELRRLQPRLADAPSKAWRRARTSRSSVPAAPARTPVPPRSSRVRRAPVRRIGSADVCRGSGASGGHAANLARAPKAATALIKRPMQAAAKIGGCSSICAPGRRSCRQPRRFSSRPTIRLKSRAPGAAPSRRPWPPRSGVRRRGRRARWPRRASPRPRDGRRTTRPSAPESPRCDGFSLMKVGQGTAAAAAPR